MDWTVLSSCGLPYEELSDIYPRVEYGHWPDHQRAHMIQMMSCKAAVQVFQLVENPAEMATLQTYQALLVNRRQVGERGMDRMFLLKNVSPSIQCHPTPSYSETSQPGILAGSILLLPFTKVKGHRENL